MNLRDIPAVPALVDLFLVNSPSQTILPRSLLLQLAKESIDAFRKEVEALPHGSNCRQPLVIFRQKVAQITKQKLQVVINATGVILHTNFGRAPIATEALKAISETCSTYANLEYDIATNQRSRRAVVVNKMICTLTGAEDAMLVNNCAAAIYLALRGLAQGGEVVISRGELVQIGGGFRIPDILAESSARLVEVGTTNITTIDDYARAITEHTRMILIVHQSNFVLTGHTKKPTIKALKELCQKLNVLLVYDLGSGGLEHWPTRNRLAEPLVSELIDIGVDLVAFSGDKLLGGPQAGILCGHAAIIKQLSKHPMARVLRLGKLNIAALGVTIELYLEKRSQEIPVRRMISWSVDQIRVRAGHLVAALTARGITSSLIDGESTIGGGTSPYEVLPTCLVRIPLENPMHFIKALLNLDEPIAARIQDQAVVIDLRTVFVCQEAPLLVGLTTAWLQIRRQADDSLQN